MLLVLEVRACAQLKHATLFPRFIELYIEIIYCAAILITVMIARVRNLNDVMGLKLTTHILHMLL